MKKLVKFGVGLSLLGTLVACSNGTGTGEEMRVVEPTKQVETVDLQDNTIVADEEYGKFVGFSEEGIKGEFKSLHDLNVLKVMQSELSSTVLDSTTNTMYLFSDDEQWTEFLMSVVRNNNADGELDEVIDGYYEIADVLYPEYDLVISNPTNTNNALMHFENGELVYSVFE